MAKQIVIMQQKIDYCWICFNNEYNKTLTSVNSEQLIKNCEDFLETSIIIKPFEKNISVAFCSYCYMSANQLKTLEEKVVKLQKEISALSTLFSKNVLERRNRLQNEVGNNSNNKPNPQNKSSTALKNPKRHCSIAGKESGGVNKKVCESVSKEFQSDFQCKKNPDDLDTEMYGDTGEQENNNTNKWENALHLEEDIDVKYSYNETGSKVVDTIEKRIAPIQQMSTTNTQPKQQAVTTSIEDLSKLLKQPIIQLERFQPGRSKESQNINIAGAGDETISPETDTDETPPCKCSVCGLDFSDMRDLQDHVKLPDEIIPHDCSFCGKSCRSVKLLKIHERIHTGEKPFTCSYCSKSFRKKYVMIEHERIHTGEKPYLCSFCARSYSAASNLRIHEQLHVGLKPYKCSSCPKSFRRLDHLKLHEAIHSAERPFKCSSCEMTFKTKPNLQSHQQHRHKNSNEEFILP